MNRSYRWLTPLVVIVALVGVVGCSDAHTEEEKAWVDDGIDPAIVTLFVDPKIEGRAGDLIAAYEATDLDARVILVSRDRDHVARSIEESNAPSIWLAPAEVFAEHEPDPTAVDLGASPLVVAYPRDGRDPVDLEAFATGRSGTGLCAEERCGEAAHQLLDEAGLSADPAVVTDSPTLVRRVADGELEMALVYASDATVYWLRVTNGNTVSEDPDLAEQWVARAFGLEGRTGAFLDWLRSSPDARRVLFAAGLLLPPSTATAAES